MFPRCFGQQPPSPLTIGLAGWSCNPKHIVGSLLLPLFFLLLHLLVALYKNEMSRKQNANRHKWTLVIPLLAPLYSPLRPGCLGRCVRGNLVQRPFWPFLCLCISLLCTTAGKQPWAKAKTLPIFKAESDLRGNVLPRPPVYMPTWPHR